MSGLQYSHRALEIRIDKIINWLTNDTSQIASIISEWLSKETAGDFYLNLTQSKPSGAYTGYSFNCLTAILLALLLETYDSDFMQELINNNYASESNGEIWFEKIEGLIFPDQTKTNKYQNLWEKAHQDLNANLDLEDNPDLNWESAAIYLISLFLKFTQPNVNNEIILGIDQKLFQILHSFLALPPDNKYLAYKIMKSRLKWIGNTLNGIVNNLDPAEAIFYRIDYEELSNG